MEEKQLICELKKLRQVEPNKNWVVFTRGRIAGPEPKKNRLVSILEFVPKSILTYNKFAFAVLIIFGFITGAFTFAQNSLPGDPAFILKKLTERTQEIFASKQNLPTLQLQLANQRLLDLDKIAMSNQSQKLAPAIQEYQNNISQAAQDIVNSTDPNVKSIVTETQEIQQNQQKVESLGVVVGGNNQLNSALLQLLQRQINDLKVETLTPDQQKIFLEAVSDFNSGNYSSALEKIWSISNQQQQQQQ